VVEELCPELIRLVHGLWSPAECAALIAALETDGFEAAPVTTARGARMMPELRNNSRVIWDRPELAEEWWGRMGAHCFELPGWEACGLNPRFRAYRYESGERFALHADGAWRSPEGERSFLTLLLYLNEDYVGGETAIEARSGGELLRLPIRQGSLALFWHSLRHESQLLVDGRKYVLRTDVMYRRL
jgi:predicted 2-oxoglutarate/Fe(II)-dependent dioxygenase YbiX